MSRFKRRESRGRGWTLMSNGRSALCMYAFVFVYVYICMYVSVCVCVCGMRKRRSGRQDVCREGERRKQYCDLNLKLISMGVRCACTNCLYACVCVFIRTYLKHECQSIIMLHVRSDELHFALQSLEG